MKIYRYEFYYMDYEDRGGVEIYLDRDISEEEFVELYNREYAGKNVDDFGNVVMDMYAPDDTLAKIKMTDDPDRNFKYEMEGDEYRTFKFLKREISITKKN